jgi:sec-independent protein translocase protein TatA
LNAQPCRAAGAALILAWIPSIWEWMIFLAIVLLLFGSRLPSLARSLGQSITEFKKGMKEIENPSDQDKLE